MKTYKNHVQFICTSKYMNNLIKEDHIDPGLLNQEITNANEEHPMSKSQIALETVISTQVYQIVIAILVFIDMFLLMIGLCLEINISKAEANASLSINNPTTTQLYNITLSLLDYIDDTGDSVTMNKTYNQLRSCIEHKIDSAPISTNAHALTMASSSMNCSLIPVITGHPSLPELVVMSRVVKIIDYIGNAFITFFALEVLVKIYVERKHFFKDKHEVVDALTIYASIPLEYAMLFLITDTYTFLALLCLRVARVINGFLRNVNLRNKFRIDLLKKTRESILLQLETAENELLTVNSHVAKLQYLCKVHKIPEEEVNACKPKAGKKKNKNMHGGMRNLAAVSTNMVSTFANFTNNNLALVPANKTNGNTAKQTSLGDISLEAVTTTTCDSTENLEVAPSVEETQNNV